MLLTELICALILVISEAQYIGAFEDGPPAPPIPYPPRDDASSFVTSSSVTKCKIGDFIPGPTCNSFYMCTGSLYAAKKVKFQCAPGTVFDDELNVCVHGIGSKCFEGLPSSTVAPPPAPLPPAPTQGPVPPPPVPVPGPSPPPTTFRPIPPPNPTQGTLAPPAPPAGPETTTTVVPEGSCPSYDLDKSSIYECLEPGYFPSLSDCSRFYKCINTMSCIIKGFMFRCPASYHFDTSLRRCTEADKPCDILADAAGAKFQVYPVPELKPDELIEFFDNTNHYWQVMPFLPEEEQRIVPVNPASYSRGPLGTFFRPGF